MTAMRRLNETALRGYMITGEQNFLDPYRQAQTSISLTLGAFGMLISDNQTQQVLIGAIRSNYDQWLLYVRELISVRDQGGDYAAIVKQRDGKRLMDAMPVVEAMATLNKYWTISEFP